MAGYRQIHTQIWKDEWVIELDPDEKLFFIYLFSNDLASISGLYKIPVRAMVNETGIPKDKIESMLAKFQADGKVFYGDNTLFIKNMMRYHKNASPKTIEKIRKDVELVPDCEIKRIAIQYLYSMDTTPKEDTPVSILGSESRSISVIENKNKSIIESGIEIANGISPDLADAIQELSDAIVEATKLPIMFGGMQEHTAAVTEMAEAGVLREDVFAAVDYMHNNSRKIVSARSLVKPSMIAMAERRRGGPVPVKIKKSNSEQSVENIERFFSHDK